MMKKTTCLIVVLAAAILLITCEDEETVCRVVTAEYFDGTDASEVNFSYDTKGRHTKTDFSDGWYVTWTYGSNKVTEENYTDGSLSSTIVYNLNFEGLAMTSTKTKAGKNSPESSTAYDFDEEGYLISEIEVNATDAGDRDEYYYEYEDGNLVFKSHENSKSDFYSETTNEYYLDKPNKFSNTHKFTGKPNTNLLKKSTYTMNSVTITSNYSYQINDAGYVTNELQTIGTTTYEIHYIYDCN
ncbi:MAG: hypothetical protein JW973_07435 [Bacteroidales bacterium]|nr:hypothetical protein [Bacteroidales bacterium]